MLSTFENQSKWLMPHQKLEGMSLMDHLFNRLNGTYPNKWRVNFRDEQAIEDWRQAWAEAFDDEGVMPNDVALGIKNCRRMYDWPPSLPEFLRACRPNLEPDVAFFEAVRGMESRSKGEAGVWTHPAIYHAAVMVGQYEVRTQSYQQLKSRWEKALAEQLALGQWACVPEVVAQLPAADTTVQDAENARKVRQQVASATNGSRNHLDWVERVLNDQKDRCDIAIKYAKQVAKERNLPVWQKFKHEEVTA